MNKTKANKTFSRPANRKQHLIKVKEKPVAVIINCVVALPTSTVNGQEPRGD